VRSMILGLASQDALDVWSIDANLHLWLDHKSWKTTRSLLSYDVSVLDLNVNSEFSGLDGSM